MPSELTVLPATETMVAKAATWVETVLPTLDKKYSPGWLQSRLEQGLRDGVLTLSIKAVEAAEKREDEIADAALRTVFQEMLGGAITERGPGHLQVWAYGQRAIKRPPLTRGRGGEWYDNWYRDLEICLLISLACTQFGLHPTRNRAARHANSVPSGTSIIVAALGRNRIHLDESSVQENIWFGLPGELARRALAERALGVQ
jgi:hypothetical protein